MKQLLIKNWDVATAMLLGIIGLPMFVVGYLSCNYKLSDCGVVVGLLALVPLLIQSWIDDKANN